MLNFYQTSPFKEKNRETGLKIFLKLPKVRVVIINTFTQLERNKLTRYTAYGLGYTILLTL